MIRQSIYSLLIGFAFAFGTNAVAQDGEDGITIDAQPLAAALREFSERTGLQIGYAAEITAGKSTSGVSGVADPGEALAVILRNSGLEYRFVNDDTVVVRPASSAATAVPAVDNAAPASAPASSDEDDPDSDSDTADDQEISSLQELRSLDAIIDDETIAKESRGLMDVIVVTGSRNVGIRRFEDDPQPYVVFNSDDLESSAATNLEDFLRTRLPQNTAQASNQQFTSIDGSLGNTSSINLRGLGANQTLILVNGRRAPRVSFNDGTNADFQQADINGIPLASIERIEVLPATASGIYGGGATGGVINIITRRDYSGSEVQLRYGNTTDGAFDEYGVDASYGFALEGGKTHILLSGSYSDSSSLLTGERDFGDRSLQLLLQNDPDGLFDSFTPSLAATTNIRSISGPLVLLDGTDLGSNVTHVPFGYTGVASDNGQALIDNAGSYNLSPSEDFDGLLRPIRQSPKVYSGSASIRREFSPKLEAYLDGWFSRNEAQRRVATLPRTVGIPGGVPGNPFQGTVVVTYPSLGPTFASEATQETLQFVGGVQYELATSWVLSADYNWSRARTESTSTSPGFDVVLGVNPAIRSGLIDVFRDLSQFPVDLSPFAVLSPNNIVGPRDTELRNFAVRVSGPAFELPAGSVNISALLETRDETLEDSYDESYNFISGAPGTLDTFFIPERSQSTDSIYLEALVPLLEGETPLLQSLELQLSARYDRYETESPAADARFAVGARGDVPTGTIERAKNSFSSADYTAGFRYVVSEDVLFRGSFGTGFLPPSVNQVFAQEDPNFFVTGTDPKRGGNPFFTQTRVRFGGNPDLEPEESESWSFGAIFTPRFLPGFRLSVDYSVVEKDGEILFPINQQILDLEDSFPDRVVRADLTPADIAAGFTGGEIEFFDRTALNFAKTKSTSLDLQLDQVFETDDYGDFRLYGVATKMEDFESQLTPDSEVIDSVGFDGGPLDWRINAGATWESPRDVWSLGWNAQYYHNYFVYTATASEFIVDQTTRRQGRADIPAETYHDFFVAYRANVDGWLGELLADTVIRLGVQNAFDKVPAAIPSVSPTDGRFSAYGDNRLRRYTLSFRKSFN